MNHSSPFVEPTRAPRTTKARRVEEEQQFLDQLCKIQPSSVIFYSLSPLVHKSVPSRLIRKLPCPLTSLHDQKYEKMSKGEIEAVCEERFSKGVVIITPDEAAYLEESTRLQAQSLVWIEHRIGRITSSIFLDASRASLNPPPLSLVKQIMEENSLSESISALKWRRSNENQGGN